MLDIKLNGKPYAIAQSLEDVTIGRFIELRNLELTDLNTVYWAIDAKPIILETETVTNELANIIAITRQLINEMYEFMASTQKNEIPRSVTVLGYEVKLIDGLLDELPFWPYEVAKKCLEIEGKKETFDPTDSIPRIIGHYLYSAVTKSAYDDTKAEQFVKDIAVEIPMCEAIQLGNFFFYKLRNTLPTKLKSLILKPRKATRKQV